MPDGETQVTGINVAIGCHVGNRSATMYINRINVYGERDVMTVQVVKWEYDGKLGPYEETIDWGGPAGREIW